MLYSLPSPRLLLQHASQHYGHFFVHPIVDRSRPASYRASSRRLPCHTLAHIHRGSAIRHATTLLLRYSGTASEERPYFYMTIWPRSCTYWLAAIRNSSQLIKETQADLKLGPRSSHFERSLWTLSSMSGAAPDIEMKYRDRRETSATILFSAGDSKCEANCFH